MKFTVATILAFTPWALPTMALPHNGTSPNVVLKKRLGINCRGSGNCNGLCGIKLTELMGKVNDIEDSEEYANDEHIACKRCGSCPNCRTHPSICVFPQKLKSGQKVSAMQAKRALKALQDHGCSMCGSYPIGGNNDVKEGEITVNYVTLRQEPE